MDDKLIPLALVRAALDGLEKIYIDDAAKRDTALLVIGELRMLIGLINPVDAIPVSWLSSIRDSLRGDAKFERANLPDSIDVLIDVWKR